MNNHNIQFRWYRRKYRPDPIAVMGYGKRQTHKAPTLQYREKCNEHGFFTLEWSEWQDVPIVEEE